MHIKHSVDIIPTFENVLKFSLTDMINDHLTPTAYEQSSYCSIESAQHAIMQPIFFPSSPSSLSDGTSCNVVGKLCNTNKTKTTHCFYSCSECNNVFRFERHFVLIVVTDSHTPTNHLLAGIKQFVSFDVVRRRMKTELHKFEVLKSWITGGLFINYVFTFDLYTTALLFGDFCPHKLFVTLTRPLSTPLKAT